jgi:molecular chaperone DnaK (HSP70)
LAARRWIEAKLKADETLAATKNALASCAGEIEKDYREKIESAARNVEKVLTDENSENGFGDLKQLQSAIATLDAITKPLAELLMDKAMEAMLKKRGLIQ